MAVSVGVRRVRRTAAGRVNIVFSDKFVLDLESPQAVREWANEIDALEARQVLYRMLIRWWLHKNPTGNDASLIEGKMLRLDLSGATLMEVIDG